MLKCVKNIQNRIIYFAVAISRNDYKLSNYKDYICDPFCFPPFPLVITGLTDIGHA